jgi:1,2-diacylglycerol 3-beta-glucosyltransferase
VLALALELFLVALGLTYFAATTSAGLRVRRPDNQGRGGCRKPARAAVSGRGDGVRADGVQPYVAQAQPRGARAQPRGVQAHGRQTLLQARLARWLRRLWQRTVTAQDTPLRAGVMIDPADCLVYFIVPCLNQERVIEESLPNLLADPRGTVVLVGDASADRSRRLASALDSERVLVVRCGMPAARTGKGPALNAAFNRVRQHVAARGIAPSRVTVCVLDAGARLSDGGLDVVLPLFADPRMGGVQLPVRIRRERRSLLTLLQDLEFWGVGAVAQLGRIGPGTVSLSGNGQFTRFSALLELGRNPWRARLTEDLDLAVALATAGWRLTWSRDAFVSQQGLPRLRALISQRARSYQGQMQAGRWLPTVWSGRRLSRLSMLELTVDLLVPWALVQPWSLIFNYNLVLMALRAAGWVTGPGRNADLTLRILTVVSWYGAACIPAWMAGLRYGRQRGKAGPLRALALGHLLLIGNYVTYIAYWRAFFRLITGTNGREKTKRHREPSHRRPGRPVSATFASEGSRPVPVAGRAAARSGQAGLAGVPAQRLPSSGRGGSHRRSGPTAPRGLRAGPARHRAGPRLSRRLAAGRPGSRSAARGLS